MIAYTQDEYASLFLPRGSPSPAKGALVATFRKQLTEWGPLLQRFLRSEDDQVGVLVYVRSEMTRLMFVYVRSEDDQVRCVCVCMCVGKMTVLVCVYVRIEDDHGVCVCA